jgi:hypothetical protein
MTLPIVYTFFPSSLTKRKSKQKCLLVINNNLSLKFKSKAMRLPLKGPPERRFTWVGSGLTCNSWIRKKDLQTSNVLAFTACMSVMVNDF